MRPGLKNGAGILLLAGTVVLAGCGGSSPMIETPPTKPVPPATSSLQGQVFGGQQPVTGMALQMYETGSSGYGSAATGMLATPLPLTDSSGNFHFPTPTCTNSADQVYLVGTGGDPVAGNAANGNSTAVNSNLALMVALGNCTGLSTLPHLDLDELTTVAAVWALAPFMSGTSQSYQNIGTSPGNALGLQLAFQAAQQVANISTGKFPGTLPANATLPIDELNTIADILEACINSKGGTANDGSTPCGSLFGDTPSSSSVYPTDVITAAMNIAQNPTQNAAALFNLASPTGAFQSELGSAPHAWTVAIKYTGAGLSAPAAIATDQSGNVWVTNSGASTVSQFDNTGTPAGSFGTNGVTLAAAPGDLAIDLTGNAWITIPGNNSVVELSSSGSVLKTVSDSSIGLNHPTSIAIDGGGNIWVVNSASGANSVSAFDSTGTKLTNSAFSGGGISSPVAIAINGNANANCSDCH